MIDDKAINTYAIKLTGKAFLPKPLEIGKNYHTDIEGSITSLTEEDNNDGTHTFYYKFEPVIIKVIDEKGETIKAKDTRRASQRLRSAIWKEWSSLGVNEEFDDYYEKKMSGIIKQILEF